MNPNRLLAYTLEKHPVAFWVLNVCVSTLIVCGLIKLVS
jgi:hypothetical protein